MELNSVLTVIGVTAFITLITFTLGIATAAWFNQNRFDAYRLGRKDEKYGYNK